MAAPTPPAAPAAPPTRFELELEFVTLLANPFYLSHLAATKALARPEFVAYLRYLWPVWRAPAYARHLRHPAASLRALEMLQQARFRADILRPEVLSAWADALVQEQGPPGAAGVVGGEGGEDGEAENGGR